MRIHARQRRWNSQIKHRQGEGFSVIQRTIRMASIMARVSLMEIRLPVPFQPVLTRYACAPEACMRFTSTSAYCVGCSDRKAAPKQAENVGVGSVTPRSVPASLAVKPEEVILRLAGSQAETGGSTPNASAVRKITFVA